MTEERKDESEYGGGTINRQCPACGQFCKGEYYRPKFDPTLAKPYPSYIDHTFVGCFCDSFCKRCNKPVQLSVEFL